MSQAVESDSRAAADGAAIAQTNAADASERDDDSAFQYRQKLRKLPSIVLKVSGSQLRARLEQYVADKFLAATPYVVVLQDAVADASADVPAAVRAVDGVRRETVSALVSGTEAATLVGQCPGARAFSLVLDTTATGSNLILQYTLVQMRLPSEGEATADGKAASVAAGGLVGAVLNDPDSLILPDQQEVLTATSPLLRAIARVMNTLAGDDMLKRFVAQVLVVAARQRTLNEVVADDRLWEALRGKKIKAISQPRALTSKVTEALFARMDREQQAAAAAAAADPTTASAAACPPTDPFDLCPRGYTEAVCVMEAYGWFSYGVALKGDWLCVGGGSAPGGQSQPQPQGAVQKRGTPATQSDGSGTGASASPDEPAAEKKEPAAEGDTQLKIGALGGVTRRTNGASGTNPFVSRAYFKLQEVLDYVDRHDGEFKPADAAGDSALAVSQWGWWRKSDHDGKEASRSKKPAAVDIGASPGGWSFALAERDAAVLAIDPGLLAIEHPNIRHIQAKVQDPVATQALADVGPFDAIVCDMNCSIDAAIDAVFDGILSHELAKIGSLLVITVKQTVRSHSLSNQVSASAGRRLTPYFSSFQSMLLLANRKETTFVGVRNSNPFQAS